MSVGKGILHFVIYTILRYCAKLSVQGRCKLINLINDQEIQILKFLCALVFSAQYKAKHVLGCTGFAETVSADYYLSAFAFFFFFCCLVVFSYLSPLFIGSGLLHCTVSAIY